MQGIKRALVIGGTGSLGTELINQLKGWEVTSLSRDEQKQQMMKKIYPNVKFVLGDVRDKDSISRHFIGKSVIFHVAALKHVDHIEENPIESVKTNILGSINVAECALNHHIERCVFSSTDKAVDAINVYGNCKAISEKIFFDYNKSQENTRFAVYRWGNVAASNGSAIPYFIECLKNKKPVPITDPKMTRFWITIDMAVKFMLSSYKSELATDQVMIPPLMKSAKVLDVLDCLADLLGVKEYKTQVIGVRRGEKLHECLTSMHSSNYVASDNCEKYTEAELKHFLKPLVVKEQKKWQRLSSESKAPWARDTEQSLTT